MTLVTPGLFMTTENQLKSLREVPGLYASPEARILKVPKRTYLSRQIKGRPYIAMETLLEVSLPKLFLGKSSSVDLLVDIANIEKIIQRMRLKL